ncbi:MAG: C10 family peptidase [Bacteroidales bacterium]|nr:C10 family peptidase [Candidatus Cryptobacteroides aphodequi]
MKKTIFIIVSLLWSVLASAEVVDYAKAEAFAKKYFASGKVTPVNARTVAATSSAAEPEAFHIFNNENGGWVIIAGDDVAAPVLAYSPTGSLDMTGIQENTSMNAWLGTVKIRIKEAKAKNAAPSKAWTGGARMSGYGSGKVIETALWGQGSPFNDLCPLDDGYRSVTGCVATAMSIVLRHHQYPAHGTGTLPSYTTRTKGIKVEGYSIDDHFYDWDLMPYDQRSFTTDAQRNAVAQLVHDCGVMVQMDYTANSSGAFSEDIIPALAEHMGYTKTARFISRSSVSNDQWLEMIAGEIDNGRPVLYSGVSNDGGHQFVCDGYDGKGNVRINWGWNGSCNGYFSVSYLGDNNSGVFSNYDDAIFGLKPATSSEPGYVPDLNFIDGGISVSDDIAKGTTFKVSIESLANLGAETFDGNLAIFLADRNNVLKEMISSKMSTSIPSMNYGGPSSASCTITSSDIKPDDGIVLAYQWNGEWYVVGSTTAYGGNPIARCGVLDVPVIVIRDNIRPGENLYFNLNPGREAVNSVSWYYDDRVLNYGYVTASTGIHAIKAVVRYSSGNSDTLYRQIEVK